MNEEFCRLRRVLSTEADSCLIFRVTAGVKSSQGGKLLSTVSMRVAFQTNWPEILWLKFFFKTFFRCRFSCILHIIEIKRFQTFEKPLIKVFADASCFSETFCQLSWLDKENRL